MTMMMTTMMVVMMTMIKWTLFIRLVLPILFTFDVISMFPFFYIFKQFIGELCQF